MQSERIGFDPFHRSPGNGSRNGTSDWVDQMSIYDNEWGSTAATTFKPSGTDGKGHEIPESKRERYKTLYKLHNGKGERSRKSDIRTSHIRNDAQMFMSVLEMPDIERQRVLNILADLDLESKNFGGEKYEKVLLSLCSLVADESLSNKPNASVDDRLFLTDEFRELMDITGTSSTDLRNIRKHIRELTDAFDE